MRIATGLEVMGLPRSSCAGLTRASILRTRMDCIRSRIYPSGHLVGDGRERVADHFERDGVEGARHSITLHPTRSVRDLHHPPPTVMISSPDGATTHASRSNKTVVVPCSWMSAGPAIRSPAASVPRW